MTSDNSGLSKKEAQKFTYGSSLIEHVMREIKDLTLRSEKRRDKILIFSLNHQETSTQHEQKKVSENLTVSKQQSLRSLPQIKMQHNNQIVARGIFDLLLYYHTTMLRYL